MQNRRIRLASLALFFLSLLLFLVSARYQWGRKQGRTEPPKPLVYVGSEACAPCHADVYAIQAHTVHFKSLRFAKPSLLGAETPSPGPILGTNVRFVRDDDSLLMTRPKNQTLVLDSSPDETMPLELAFGGGRTILDFVALAPGGVIDTAHFCYAPKMKRWFITPGQERLPRGALMLTETPAWEESCMSCHSIKPFHVGDLVEAKWMGVGCESCHGPGSRHVEAMKRGQFKDIQYERLGTRSATQINDLCAKCHRSQTNVVLEPKLTSLTQDIPLLGIQRSRCYQESKARLSCIDCHNAHTDVDMRNADYEKVCLSCHGGASERQPRLAEGLTLKSCPVNSRTGCLDCHMPRRNFMDNSLVPKLHRDHRIAVYKKPAH